MNIHKIISRYRRRDKNHHKKRKAIEDQIAVLNKELDKLRHPYWTEEIIQPIAEELKKFFPNFHYEILGPFGICCEVAIHFYKNGVTDKNRFKIGNCKAITFRPIDLTGPGNALAVKDYSKNTKEFRENTIGEMNGMNHPDIPVSDYMDIEALAKLVK
jgi:hypothetical protein